MKIKDFIHLLKDKRIRFVYYRNKNKCEKKSMMMFYLERFFKNEVQDVADSQVDHPLIDYHRQTS